MTPEAHGTLSSDSRVSRPGARQSRAAVEVRGEEDLRTRFHFIVGMTKAESSFKLLTPSAAQREGALRKYYRCIQATRGEALPPLHL